MNNHKILVVDDDPAIAELLRYNLEKEEFMVKTAAGGTEAVSIAKQWVPDLILMDIMMPGMDGVEACRQIRNIQSLTDVSIIFLTARSEEYSEVAAFEAGGDDYLVKPVKPRALISRISAHFRRENGQVEKSSTVTFRDISIDRDSFTVFKDKEKLSLAKKEFELLYFLCQHPNKIFNRDELLKQVWGMDVFVVSRTVDVHIRKIREKIGSDYIFTVKGIGYKLNLPD